MDNNDVLLRWACDKRTVVRMEHGVGAFVVQDTALVSFALIYLPDQETMNALGETYSYSIGCHRMTEQNPSWYQGRLLIWH